MPRLESLKIAYPRFTKFNRKYIDIKNSKLCARYLGYAVQTFRCGFMPFWCGFSKLQLEYGKHYLLCGVSPAWNAPWMPCCFKFVHLHHNNTLFLRIKQLSNTLYTTIPVKLVALNQSGKFVLHDQAIGCTVLMSFMYFLLHTHLGYTIFKHSSLAHQHCKLYV